MVGSDEVGCIVLATSGAVVGLLLLDGAVDLLCHETAWVSVFKRLLQVGECSLQVLFVSVQAFQSDGLGVGDVVLQLRWVGAVVVQVLLQVGGLPIRLGGDGSAFTGDFKV